MLPSMPKKENTEEHQEIKPTSPIMKRRTKQMTKLLHQNMLLETLSIKLAH